MPTFKNTLLYFKGMVRIKSDTTKEGFAAIMIDGYAPEPEEFEDLPWGKITKDKRIKFKNWLDRIRSHQKAIKKDYKETTYLTAYRNAIQEMMRGFCHAKKEVWSFPDKFVYPLCYYRGFSTGHTSGSIEVPRNDEMFDQTLLKTYLPVLQQEYRHDEQEGKLHYLQNVILHSDVCDKQIEECCEDWIRTFHFYEKPSNAYVDLDRFKDAWHELLHGMAQNYRYIFRFTCIYD